MCLGRTGGTATPRLLRDSRRWWFGVCSHRAVALGLCCRNGLVYVAPETCLGRAGGTATLRLLRDSRRWWFSVCSQRGKLSGWGAVETLDWWTLLWKRALGERGVLRRLATFTVQKTNRLRPQRFYSKSAMESRFDVLQIGWCAVAVRRVPPDEPDGGRGWDQRARMRTAYPKINGRRSSAAPSPHVNT
jgi:hypothetical protein